MQTTLLLYFSAFQVTPCALASAAVKADDAATCVPASVPFKQTPISWLKGSLDSGAAGVRRVAVLWPQRWAVQAVHGGWPNAGVDAAERAVQRLHATVTAAARSLEAPRRALATWYRLQALQQSCLYHQGLLYCLLATARGEELRQDHGQGSLAGAPKCFDGATSRDTGLTVSGALRQHPNRFGLSLARSFCCGRSSTGSSCNPASSAYGCARWWALRCLLLLATVTAAGITWDVPGATVR